MNFSVNQEHSLGKAVAKEGLCIKLPELAKVANMLQKRIALSEHDVILRKFLENIKIGCHPKIYRLCDFSIISADIYDVSTK